MFWHQRLAFHIHYFCFKTCCASTGWRWPCEVSSAGVMAASELQFMEVLHDFHGDSFNSDRWDQYIFVCGFPLISGVEKTFLIRVSKAEAVDPGNASLYTPCTSMRNQDLAWYAQEVRHEAMPMCGLFRIWPVWKETTHSLGTRDKGNGTCTLYTFDAIYMLHPA